MNKYSIQKSSYEYSLEISRKLRMLWVFLIIINLSNISSISFGEVVSDPKTDSLRKALSDEKGSNKISTKLDLALQIYHNEKTEAVSLAKSALREAQKAGNKTFEMRSYYVLGRIRPEFNNIAFSQAYYDSALIISEAIDDNWYKGELLFRKGVNQHNNREDVLAFVSFNEAIQACRLSNNFKIIGSTYSMMGTIFRVNGVYDRAIEYIIKSKLNYEKANYVEGYVWAEYLLGRIHADLKLPEKAREYFEKALEDYREMAIIDGNNSGVALCLEQLGLLNLESGNFEEARENIESVLKIHSESESQYGLSNAYKHMGQIECSVGNYLQAENYLSKALKIKKEISESMGLASIYEYLGLCMIGRGIIEEGLNTIHQGLELALSNNQKKIELDIYSKLTKTYLSLNDHEKAIFYQNKQIEVQDLILSGAADIKMEQLQAIYEIDIKNNQIEQLEKQNEINSLRIKQQKIFQIIMIIGILLALFISIIIYLFYNKIRLKNLALKEANATKDKLFSIIAHDLKGPISTLYGLSGSLVQEVDKDDLSKAKKLVSLINQSLSDTYNLLSNLLEWAGSQLQRIKFNPQQLVLLDVINEVRDLLSHQANKKNILLEIKVEKTHHAFADKDMLNAILRNLMSNAIKFSNENEKISISSNLKDNFIELSVRDNGVGMEPYIVKNLFNLETNASTPGTCGETGTGLGLILVKEFVEKQGGKIWLESEVNKGSVFSFALPVK